MYLVLSIKVLFKVRLLHDSKRDLKKDRNKKQEFYC